MFIVAAAWKRGAARITVLRMMLNLTIENIFGAIPIVGDFAHIAWKANRRNYNLLLRDQQSVPPSYVARLAIWVIGACLLICVLFLGPVVLLVYLFRSHRLW